LRRRQPSSSRLNFSTYSDQTSGARLYPQIGNTPVVEATAQISPKFRPSSVSSCRNALGAAGCFVGEPQRARTVGSHRSRRHRRRASSPAPGDSSRTPTGRTQAVLSMRTEPHRSSALPEGTRRGRPLSAGPRVKEPRARPGRIGAPGVSRRGALVRVQPAAGTERRALPVDWRATKKEGGMSWSVRLRFASCRPRLSGFSS